MKTLKNVIKWSFTLGYIAAVMIACSKGNNNTPPPPIPPGPPGPGPVCPNCVAGGGMLVSAYGKNTRRTMEMALTFSTNQPIQGVAPGAPISEPLMYVGPAVASGILFVNPGLANGVCNIPPGQYQINTVRPADWNQRSFFNLQAEAISGPYRLLLQFSNYMGVDPAIPPTQGINGQYPYRIRGPVAILSMNGQDCKAQFYPWAPFVEDMVD